MGDTFSIDTKTAWKNASGASYAPVYAQLDAFTFAEQIIPKLIRCHRVNAMDTCTKSTTSAASIAIFVLKPARRRPLLNPNCLNSVSAIRNDAIYTKDELVVGDDGLPQRQPWELWHEGDDLATSGWMRATAPSGNPDYQNRSGWSGELGYGIRSPEMGQHDRPEPQETDNETEEDGHSGVSH